MSSPKIIPSNNKFYTLLQAVFQNLDKLGIVSVNSSRVEPATNGEEETHRDSLTSEDFAKDKCFKKLCNI